MDDAVMPPLPPIPCGTSDWTHTHARPTIVAGQHLVLLPFAAPVGTSRGRRFLVRFEGESQPRQRVVLNVAGTAAMPAPPDVAATSDSVPVSIRALRQQRDRRLPKGLAESLERLGLSVENAPEAELLQLIVMVNESGSDAIRQQRMHAAVQVIAAWNHHA